MRQRAGLTGSEARLGGPASTTAASRGRGSKSCECATHEAAKGHSLSPVSASASGRSPPATAVQLRHASQPSVNGSVRANGLPLYQGAQVAVDTTLVSPVSRDGTARARADREPGAAASDAARRKRQETYPELLAARRCKLVVVGLEVGGRLTADTVTFLRLLADARARAAPTRLRPATRQASVHRWTGLLAVAAQRAYASSLLELPLLSGEQGEGDAPPLGDLLAQARGRPPPDLDILLRTQKRVAKKILAQGSSHHTFGSPGAVCAMQAAELLWRAVGWGLSASSSTASFAATLPTSCRQSVTHAFLTCGWGAPPYHASGFAPLPACWGWLLAGVLLGIVAREAIVLILLCVQAPPTRGRSPAQDTTAAAATEVVRSWELGGDGEVGELARRAGLSTTALLCKLLRETLREPDTKGMGRSLRQARSRGHGTKP